MVKLAFVAPWYGENIPGGAETAARQMALHLSQDEEFTVEVLTTCIRDLYADWGKNFHKPGTSRKDGVTVHRFPVESRNRQAFDDLNWRLMNNLSITTEQEHVFISEMMKAPALYEYMAKLAHEYLFIFIPYMFATTYYGLQVAPNRSILIPCLHDEGYAYLGEYRRMLTQPKALVFLSAAECSFLEQLVGPTAAQIRTVVGSGIDANFEADGDRFRQKYGLSMPFVLYAGRREPGKNIQLLIDYWLQYVHKKDSQAKLVLIGPGDVSVPASAGSHVADLGYVTRQDKYDAFAAADVLCMPSVNESFSIVLMESWATGTPVLVHGECPVTREHCLKSNGGLYFANFDEFAAALDFFLENPHLARKIGEQGRSYVLNNYQWPDVIARLKTVIEQVMTT